MYDTFKTDVAMRRVVRELIGGKQDGRSVFIISGAPGSGKSTYVRRNKQNGDLVVDLDLLAAALQGDTVAHPSYETVMDAVVAARESVYQTIESRKGKWKNAFVITSSPDSKTVEDIARRLDGKVIQMQASKEECVKRIRDDATRTETERDVRLAEEWYSDHQNCQNSL